MRTRSASSTEIVVVARDAHHFIGPDRLGAGFGHAFMDKDHGTAAEKARAGRHRLAVIAVGGAADRDAAANSRAVGERSCADRDFVAQVVSSNCLNRTITA